MHLHHANSRSHAVRNVVQLKSVLVVDVVHASGVNKADIHVEQGRDVWYQDVIPGQSDSCSAEWVDSEHPLFLLYTSGSTGSPKGVQVSTTMLRLQLAHSHGGSCTADRIVCWYVKASCVAALRCFSMLHRVAL